MMKYKFYRSIKYKYEKFKSRFKNTFDFFDLLTLIGLIMIFYGLYNWKPNIAFVCVGLIVLFLSNGDKGK